MEKSDTQDLPSDQKVLLSKTLEAFQATYKTADAELRKAADIFQDRLSFNDNFIEVIHQILSMQEVSIHDKTAAATFLNKNLGVMKLTKMLTEEQKSQYLMKVFDAIMNKGQPLNVLNILMETQGVLLSMDLNGTNLSLLYPKVWEEVKTLENSRLISSLKCIGCFCDYIDTEAIPDAFYTETLLKLGELGTIIVPQAQKQLSENCANITDAILVN